MPSASVRDVAALAGVSVGTVSNVLNRPERVSGDVVQRVKGAIAELGYVPNSAARQLRMGQSTAIGMIVLDVGNPFFASLIRGAEDRAARDDFSVLVANSDEDDQRESRYLTMFEQERIRGVLISPVGDATHQLRRLRDRGIPAVLVDRAAADGAFSSVAVDNVAGGRLAAEHLTQRGSRRIAFAGGPFSIGQVADRYRGAREALGREIEILPSESLSLDAGRAIGAVLARRNARDRPDAVFAANDLIAIGLLQSLLQADIRVPDDMALIGYDDIAFASAAAVPLSSVRQPGATMGSTAMDLLLQLAAHPATPLTHVGFQPTLVVRESTAPRRV